MGAVFLCVWLFFWCSSRGAGEGVVHAFLYIPLGALKKKEKIFRQLRFLCVTNFPLAYPVIGGFWHLKGLFRKARGGLFFSFCVLNGLGGIKVFLTFHFSMEGYFPFFVGAIS